MANTREYAILHHTGTSIHDNDDQFEAVKAYHIRKGYGDIGYHYFITSQGKVRNGRHDHLSGAHCRQKLMNYRSLGICLEGNFSIDEPTEEQIEALRKLIIDLKKEYGIKSDKIVGHRTFSNTSCPGDKFTNALIDTIAKESHEYFNVSKWAMKAVRWCIKNKIATNWELPHAPVSKEEKAVMDKRLYDLIIKDVKKLLKLKK